VPAILIIDDDQKIRSWLRTILEAEGHQVVEAGDGHEGLACFHRVSPGLVVLDIYLPGKEGLEIILTIRKSDRAVKILAISGNLVEGYDACKAATVFGANDALAKPFGAETFRAHVERLLSSA
jgi:DNA-binding response OmpR family regulator